MSISFDQPRYLALLALVPLLWWFSFRALAGLGNVRRAVVLLLRSAVIALLVLALAQMQWVRTSGRLTVLYLLDQSSSIPESQRRMMADFVNQSVAKHRKVDDRDRAGVIVFAKDAAVEYPPIDDDIRLAHNLDTPLDTAHANLATALKLALATLPGDSASRVVIVTDGNENLGDAMTEARRFADRGIGIDVVPIRYPARSEVVVEKLTVPLEVQSGQPFGLRVVLNNTVAPSANAQPARGHLHVFRKTHDGERELANEALELPPGKKVFDLHETIDAADAYTYAARFVPDDDGSTQFHQNKEATGFTQVRGQGRVLLIEDVIDPGEYDLLVDRLRREKLSVTVINTDELFTSLAELQPFDTVILANVPKEAFSKQQVEMLVANTQELGAGLIMLGGPNSFGAGGWEKTELEKALPVDCEVKNLKVRPTGALALVIDRSGSMKGEKLAMAKAAAAAAADILNDTDYVTVAAFDFVPQLVVPLVKKGSSTTIKSRIDQLGADGGTNMQPGIEMAREQLLRATDASTRHMVILTDGLTEGSGYGQLVQDLRKEKITVSTVGVGPDADLRLLEQMAAVGGGHFYHATNPRVLPRIFQQEARVVARPLVFERKSGIVPQIKFPHEMLKGIAGPLPPITGFVMTTLKDSPLVEVALLSPVSTEEANNTLLASWTYGLGKVVAFTSDAGRRWASDWATWPNYDKLFSQMVRWSMRPSGDQGKFSIASEIQDGKVRVVVNALDKDDQFLNFLNPRGSVVGPNMQRQNLQLTQVAPGRYVGEFSAPDAGGYFFTLATAPGTAPIVSGVNVPYSPEFAEQEANEALLKSLAGIKPAGSEAGMLIETSASGGANGAASELSLSDRLSRADVFRHTLRPASARTEAWPDLLLLASCVFFCDVFVRRVRVDFSWIPPAMVQLRNRLLARPTPAVVATIARLQSRKTAVLQTIESQKAGVRFEPIMDEMPSDSIGEQSVGDQMSQTANQQVDSPTFAESQSPAEQESYTQRLLKIKQQIRDDRL